MNAKSFKVVRLQKGLTQQEMAEVLNVSRSTVEAIENGRRPISDTVRARLAQIVNTEEFIPFFERYSELENIIPI